MTAIKHACELMKSNFSSDPSLGTRLPMGKGESAYAQKSLWAIACMKIL